MRSYVSNFLLVLFFLGSSTGVRASGCLSLFQGSSLIPPKEAQEGILLNLKALSLFGGGEYTSSETIKSPFQESLKWAFLSRSFSEDSDVRLEAIQDILFQMEELDASVLQRTVQLLADPVSEVRIHAFEFLLQHPDFGVSVLGSAHRRWRLGKKPSPNGLTRESLLKEPADKIQLEDVIQEAKNRRLGNSLILAPQTLDQEHSLIHQYAVTLNGKGVETGLLARRLLDMDPNLRMVSKTILSSNLDLGRLDPTQVHQVAYWLMGGVSHPFNREIRSTSQKLLVQLGLMSRVEAAAFRMIAPMAKPSWRNEGWFSARRFVGYRILKRIRNLSEAAFEGLLLGLTLDRYDLNIWTSGIVKSAVLKQIKRHPNPAMLARAFVKVSESDILLSDSYEVVDGLRDRLKKENPEALKEILHEIEGKGHNARIRLSRFFE